MNEQIVNIIEKEIRWYTDLIAEYKQSDNYPRASECSEAVAALRSIIRKINSESNNPVIKPSELTN